MCDLAPAVVTVHLDPVLPCAVARFAGDRRNGPFLVVFDDCGEMAGDPYVAVILLGLGLDVFSMSSFSIPEIKNIIRSVSMVEAEELVGTIFEMKSYIDIDRFVRGWMD